MSEENARVITTAQAEEWELNYNPPGKLADEFIERRRWYSWRRVIFTAPDDGLVYAAEYRDPATEIQEDMDPWDDKPEVTLTRYEPYEKTVTAWRPVGSEPTKPQPDYRAALDQSTRDHHATGMPGEQAKASTLRAENGLEAIA